MYAMENVYRSKDTLRELVLSLYHVGSRIELRLRGLAAGTFTLGHLTGSVYGILGHAFTIYFKYLGNAS